MPCLIRVFESINEVKETPFFENIACTIASICQRRPKNSFHHVSPLIPALACRISTRNIQVLEYICYALCRISEPRTAEAGPSVRDREHELYLQIIEEQPNLVKSLIALLQLSSRGKISGGSVFLNVSTVIGNVIRVDESKEQVR